MITSLMKFKEAHFWCGITDGAVEVHKTQK